MRSIWIQWGTKGKRTFIGWITAIRWNEEKWKCHSDRLPWWLLSTMAARLLKYPNRQHYSHNNTTDMNHHFIRPKLSLKLPKLSPLSKNEPWLISFFLYLQNSFTDVVSSLVFNLEDNLPDELVSSGNWGEKGNDFLLLKHSLSKRDSFALKSV